MGTITHKYRGVHDAELLEADLNLLKFIHIAVVEQGEPMHFQRSLGNTVTTDPGQWAEGFDEGTTLSGLDKHNFNHPTESNEFILKANELAVQTTGMTYQMLLERLEANGASEQEMMYAWDLDDQFYSGVWDYKPENVMLNRQGTWGGDNSEEILAAGGDPRRPGVKLRPIDNPLEGATVSLMNPNMAADTSKVPMPEGGQFKRRGLDAILPGSGLEWGIELGLGALLGPTSRTALKKWIDSLGNFVKKTGGGDDVLLGVTDDVMADVFSLSNRTNVQVHPSGVVSQIDQAEGIKFVDEFTAKHGRPPEDKEIILWAQNQGNALNNPIDIGPEGRVQTIKDNVLEMEGPFDRVSEFGEYPADWDHLLSPEERASRLKNNFDEAELEEIERRIKAREAGEPDPRDYYTFEEYEDAMYEYAYRGNNPEGVGFREDVDPTIVEYRPRPEPRDYQTPEAYEDAVIAYNERMEALNKTSQPKLEETRIQMREAPTIQAVTPGGREYLIGTGPISARGEPTGRRVMGQAQGWGHGKDDSTMPWMRIDFDENEALAERTIKKLDSLPQDKILFDVESGGVKEASLRGFKGGSQAQLDSLGYNADAFHLLVHKQARDEGWTTLRSSDPETFLKLRKERARQLKWDPGVPSPKKITMDTPLSPGEVELLTTFEHELAHLRFQHSYDFWTENNAWSSSAFSKAQAGYAKAMAEIDAQRYMIDTLQINPPAGGWPDWMWRGEYPRQIMDALPMDWKETHPMLGHGADQYYNPEYASFADARLRREETGGPRIYKEKNTRLGKVKDITDSGGEYTIPRIKHPIRDFHLRDGDGNIRPRIFRESGPSESTRATESAQRITDNRAIIKTAPHGEAHRIGTELAILATAGYLDHSGKGIESVIDGTDVMINVLAKVGDAVLSQAMEGAKYLKLNPGIGNQIFGMNAALSGANIITTPNDADMLDGIQGSLRRGGHNPEDIMPMDVIQDIKNGDAVVVGYETDADVDKAIDMGRKMGVYVDPDLPHIWRKPKAKFALPPKGEPATVDHLKKLAMSQIYYPESRKP